MKRIKTIFIGTSEFAVPILKTLTELEYINLVAVITQPDKPVGRKQILTPPPIKLEAMSNKLSADILQPEKIREEAQSILEKYQPELIIVASYGQIIPNSMLSYPKYGALNIHVSLLPKLRGAVPMPMAILQGFKTTGVTLQKMAKEMDKGDVISTREFELSSGETTESLTQKASNIAAEMLKDDLQKWINGEITPIPQNESEATYCYKEDIAKERAEITFETDVHLAERMVRAFYPWPIAWVRLKDGKILKICKAAISHEQLAVSSSNEIQIVKLNKSLLLHLENGALELLEVQLEGKRRDFASNYLYLAGIKS